MIQKVLQEPHKTLREVAKEVPPDEISSPAIQKIIRDMSDTLHSIDIGVGLAAPQTGNALCIFIASEEALLSRRNRKKIDREEYKKHKTEKKWKHFVFINPKIIRASGEKELLPEGCLSVDGTFGQIERRKRVVVQALNEKGRRFRRSASGLFAEVIQHEVDHLRGVLFIDRAINLEKIEDIEKKVK